MNKKECYDKVYKDILWFLKKYFSLKDFLNQDFNFLKYFIYNLPYTFFSYRLSLKKLNDDNLKKIIKDLKKELLGDKNDF